MKTEQLNLRLEADLVAALERVAREESIDRATIVRRLLADSIKRWELDHAISRYQQGEVSLGRGAEEAGITQWELQDAVRAAGISHPLEAQDVKARLDALGYSAGVPSVGGGNRVLVEWKGETIETLADLNPSSGGVLVVGINPVPVSVAAGHYYQGPLGKRLWKRLRNLGLFSDSETGKEDLAFHEAGHGLTDLVKRPTRRASVISDEELRAGREDLRRKVREWQPGLLIFPFKQAATVVLETKDLRPGSGPEFEGIASFLLTSPYAPGEQAERVDSELLDVLEGQITARKRDIGRTGRAGGGPPTVPDDYYNAPTLADAARALGISIRSDEKAFRDEVRRVVGRISQPGPDDSWSAGEMRSFWTREHADAVLNDPAVRRLRERSIAKQARA